MILKHGTFLFVIRKSDRGSNHTSTTRKVVTIMQAGFQGSRKNFFFSDICRKNKKLKTQKVAISNEIRKATDAANCALSTH